MKKEQGEYLEKEISCLRKGRRAQKEKEEISPWQRKRRTVKEKDEKDGRKSKGKNLKKDKINLSACSERASLNSPLKLAASSFALLAWVTVPKN